MSLLRLPLLVSTAAAAVSSLVSLLLTGGAAAELLPVQLACALWSLP